MRDILCKIHCFYLKYCVTWLTDTIDTTIYLRSIMCAD